MTRDDGGRRLAAILASDVVGFSRMMERDEAATLAALKRHRETLFDPTVASHNGRIVKLIGDGALVEFASVVDAVKCAIAVQRAAVAANSSAPANGPEIMLRIGINLGDIIIEGDDIYGDGVNVAARLEPQAESGGVCVAAIVNEAIGNRIDVVFQDGGEIHVKNIERPIRVWKWHPTGVNRPAAQAAAPSAKPEGPSIAVLPFQNLSGDPEQEYFSDGISEDIITDLSKISGLLVIARNSSFNYKGKSADVRTIARELGVRSILEGSIRRAGNRVRITAQLIDAASGGHIWAERYDRDLSDIFEVQDEVTRRIVEAFKVTLSPRETATLNGSEAINSEAHDCFLLGREVLFGPIKNREVFERSIDLFQQAIAADPNYGAPYAGVGMAHGLNFQNHWTEDFDRSIAVAAQYVALALEKSPDIAFVHYVAAVVAMYQKDLATWASEAEAALALSPNYALAHNVRGIIHIYCGDPLDAIPHIERAIRLDPLFRHQYVHFQATAYLVAGKYETAAALLKERIRLMPKTDLSRGFLTSALGHLGEVAAARQVWKELMEINPTYSISEHVGRLPFQDPAVAARIIEGVTKAGLPAGANAEKAGSVAPARS